MHKGILNSLLLLVSLRMCAFYLPDEYINPLIVIYLEMGCIMVISIFFMGFVFTLLEQETILEEYLTNLQDIYFQIVN